jgi:hypothetical protein
MRAEWHAITVYRYANSGSGFGGLARQVEVARSLVITKNSASAIVWNFPAFHGNELRKRVALHLSPGIPVS